MNLTALVELCLVLAAIGAALAVVALNRHWALRKMRAEERSFRELYDNISEGVFRSTLDGRMISANKALVRLNGFDSEKEMLASVTDIAGEWYVDPNRRSEIHAMLVNSGRVDNLVSEIHRYKTRERIWVEESTRLVRDKRNGQPLYYDGTVREVTETVRRRELQDRQDKIASLVSGCLYQVRRAPDGAMSMPYASVGLTHIYGVTHADVVRDVTVLDALVHPDDVAGVRASFQKSAADLSKRESEYRIRTPAGVEKWVYGHAVPEREADGSILWHGFVTDISERKRAEARIYDLAYFDPLTGLPNRTRLLETLEQALAASEKHGRHGALLFIDLDQFKVLNDTKGHHIGDRLLCEVARRLKTHVAAPDMVARLGGDEFVLILRDLGPSAGRARSDAEQLGERILASLAEPFDLDGFPFPTTASAGAVVFRGGGVTVEELLKHADLAMYDAKAAGQGSFRFFQPEMLQALEKRLALTTELREAVQRGELSLVYQAQVDDELGLTGAEALLRWDHPVRGRLEPAAFPALAEPNGLADQVDDFVIRTACATLRHWQDDPATRGLHLSVNVGAHQLNQSRLVGVVESALRETGANPKLLVIELTEHVMLTDINQVSAVMARLRDLGVRFALDDFGTGYSSLSYLKRLPIDMLKIDQSFIRDIEFDPSDRAIVQTIVSIARSLEVAVIAEGVENQAQAVLLRQLGCHAFQGYFFGRPASVEIFDAEALVRASELTETMRRRATA